MPGNKIGGKKAAATRMAKDPDVFKKIWTIGGSKGAADGVVKGFALDPERASRAGKIGGRLSAPFSKKRKHDESATK